MFVNQVEGYLDVIKKPMDLGTMREKVERFEYKTFEEFKGDFLLILSNCMLFNKTGSAYYKYAEKLKDTSRAILNR